MRAPLPGHHVGGLAVDDEIVDDVEQQAMAFAVEVVGCEHIADLVGRGVVEQQSAEHRLLGFHGVRRDLQCVDL